MGPCFWTDAVSRDRVIEVLIEGDSGAYICQFRGPGLTAARNVVRVR